MWLHPGDGRAWCHAGRVPLSPVIRRSEPNLSIQAHIDSTKFPHLVNGLSLEISRQADRIRRRSHSRDWPGAASAMTELEEAVGVLSNLVDASLLAGFRDDEPAEEPGPIPVGQYL